MASPGDKHRSAPPLPRLANVALAVIFGLSLVGFAVGIRPVGPGPMPSTPSAEPVGAAVPGQPYRQLRQFRFGASSRVTSPLSRLRRGIPALTDPVTRRPEDKAASLAARRSRRAYDGAPPTVPHPMDEQSSAVCLSCHRQGIRLQGRRAPVISHPEYANCTQCHVSSVDSGATPPVSAANDFVGGGSPGPGRRAWDGAPPTIPHRTRMRQACSSCHGTTGAPGLRTTHPQRRSCTQCHVQDVVGAEFHEPR